MKYCYPFERDVVETCSFFKTAVAKICLGSKAGAIKYCWFSKFSMNKCDIFERCGVNDNRRNAKSGAKSNFMKNNFIEIYFFKKMSSIKSYSSAKYSSFGFWGGRKRGKISRFLNIAFLKLTSFRKWDPRKSISL